ncbi:MAG TPA: amidohydrolase family protein [Burkholderiales bacterium]|nr:amidohydrolase family protein [Burkholderiales bacterium]
MSRRRFRRRHILQGAAAAAALGGCTTWPMLWPEQGFFNPCLALLPRELAEHELVQSAWDGIDTSRVWDAHAHLIGTGDSGSGITINPRMESLFNPGGYARRMFFLNAACAHESPDQIDRAYVERMLKLVDGLRPGVKLLLFAFESAHGEDGKLDAERTNFYIPDAYARDVARAHPRYFEWVASIHPYRADCVQALEQAKRDRVRAVKWIPAAMGIDPASPRCDRFYGALARLDLPLVTHSGLERAVISGYSQDLGNPLRLRRPLAAGVRVVVAHCASMGTDRDLDRGADGPLVPSFELFARLMEEARYEGRLYGDLSAMPQVNRAGPALARVIERSDWHARLLNGSDYPLPGVMPLFSVDYLVSLGLLAERAAPVLKAIRAHNPLLFDFVLKRTLRSGGKSLARGVFETRGFFERVV